MRSFLLTPALVVAALLASSKARADDRAIAEEAFREGRELMAEGKVAEACPKFAAAAQLSQTAGVRLNLADCYAKVGKTASAWSKADEALAFAERAGDSAAAALARDEMAQLKPKLSYLTLAVSKESARKGLEVALDGEKIPDAMWGTPFPVDPGEHEVTARAPGRKPWNKKTTVAGAGSRSIVAIPFLLSEETPGAAPSDESPPIGTETGADHAASSGGWSRDTAHTLAFVSGGGALVALGVGTVFGIDAALKKSQYQSLQVNGQCSAQCVSLSTDAVNAATGSTVGFVAGTVLAAAGVVFWLTAPGRGSDGSAIAVIPLAGAQSLGAGLTGSW